MFGIGLPELIVIAVLALMIIGPKELPKMARELGRSFGNLRRTVDDFKSDIRREVDEIEHVEENEPERKKTSLQEPLQEPRPPEDK